MNISSKTLWKFVILWIFCLLCPLVRASPLCDIIAATNIQPTLPHWACVSGVPGSNPCTGSWYGVGCNGSTIDSISIDGINTAVRFTGKL